MASVGHVLDLPDKEIGVALPDFRPAHVPTERGKEDGQDYVLDKALAEKVGSSSLEVKKIA